MKRKVFPFTAVLGQERIKNALIWNFINPRIGGVLVSGEKGTAKSTLIRGAEHISGKKVIELPLNITEDRLIGAIDFENAVKNGTKQLDRGILYYANKNILYVDEINLLSDNITKALLEASSEKSCCVEREGISDSYPCEFILIGSMNPEESGLRPQLLDRFGLFVEAKGEESALIRCEIIRRRIAFEKNVTEFIDEYEQEEMKLASLIKKAQERLPLIEVSDYALSLAAQLAQNANCQGNRGEIAIIETAKAICAMNGSSAVNKEAIAEAAKYALPHRMRDCSVQQEVEKPQTEPEKQSTPSNENNSADNSEKTFSSQEDSDFSETLNDSKTDVPENPKSSEDFSSANNNLDSSEKIEAIGEQFDVGRWLDDKRKILVRKGSGRRSLVKTDSLQGRYVTSAVSNIKNSDIAFDATLRAAAPYQKNRNKNGLAFSINTSDIRIKVREKRTGNFIVFVVDASGSMGVGKRMSAVKGAILSLLSDAYQKRDKVALITFRKNKADLVLGMTRSVDLAAKKLETLSTGGKTPLYAGIESARYLIKAAMKKEKDLLPVVVLVSDGRATYGRSSDPFGDAVEEGRALAADHIKTIIIDVEQDFIKLRLAEKLAKEINAEVYKISDLHAGTIISALHTAIKAM